MRDQDGPEAQRPGEAALTNSASSEEPITISGVAIGRKTKRLARRPPTERWRTIAKAISVPRIVAPSVARSPISMLARNEEQSWQGSQTLSQLSRVKPLKV